jgi:hypothetical protein
VRRKDPILLKVEQKPRDFEQSIFGFTEKKANLTFLAKDFLNLKMLISGHRF